MAMQSSLISRFPQRRRRQMIILAIVPIVLALAVLGVAGSVFAESSSTLFIEALRLKEEHRDAEALGLIEKLLEQEPKNAKILLHAAHLHFRLGWLYGEKEERRRRFFLADQAAQKALTLAPDDVAIRLITVVTKGKIAGYLSSGEQVRIAREVRAEVDSLVALLGPNHVDLLHVQSWLHFKVGKTSSLERLVAKVLFGGLPEDLDIDTAMTLMRRAMELRPQSLVYPYDLGIFYQRLGQPEEARPWFEKVLAMAPATAEDRVYQGWAQQRLERLNGAGG
jgi:tetratricopeptide (TPR) repeat protein